MRKIFLAILILILSGGVSVAQPSAADKITTARWYKVYWSGIHVADFRAQIKDGILQAKIESYGIVKTVSKFSSDYKSTFDSKNGKYIPRSYYTRFSQRHGDKTINIKYDNKGNVISDSISPPDNRAKRPAVENALKNGTFDPLTVVMEARKRIKESLASGAKDFYIVVYDGRRLARLDFKMHGRKSITMDKKRVNIVEVSFKRFPIQGFTKNELKRMDGEEPLFTLYLSESDLLPLKINAEAPLGDAILILERECGSIDNCN